MGEEEVHAYLLTESKTIVAPLFILNVYKKKTLGPSIYLGVYAAYTWRYMLRIPGSIHSIYLEVYAAYIW